MSISQVKIATLVFLVLDLFFVISMLLTLNQGFRLIGDSITSMNISWLGFVLSMFGTIMMSIKLGHATGRINTRF